VIVKYNPRGFDILFHHYITRNDWYTFQFVHHMPPCIVECTLVYIIAAKAILQKNIMID